MGLIEETSEPFFVRPVRRLEGDIQCLKVLTSSDQPPLRKMRMNASARVVYGFGDASKQGFGASVELPDKNIHWRYGQWRDREQVRNEGDDAVVTILDEVSSNYRELRNLVEVLEDLFLKGLLDGTEVFMFTDNSTAESAYFKGTSSSESLFNLVVRLRKLEMSGRCILHMIHVAGTRMIWQGTDGLSRGDKNAGVMAGESMLSFVPLHLSAFDREDTLKDWIQSWSCVSDDCISEGRNRTVARFLDPSDWPISLKGRNTYIWCPPPAAADVAAEYMARSIHVRSSSIHIFVCPRLMTSRWRRFLRKTADVLFVLPVGCDVWGKENHKPLILAISFPLSRSKPWKHGDSPRYKQFTESVQSLVVNDFGRSGFALREFIALAWALASV